MNSILRYAILLSGWVRAACSEMAIVLSVALSGAVGEMERIVCVGEGACDVVFDKPLKVFHNDGIECNGSVVI